MPQIIWTDDALTDVQRLYRFLEPRSRRAARRAVAIIRKEIKWLEKYPQLGRPAGLGHAIRRLPVQFGNEGYLVLCAEEGELVRILAVKHQREFSP